MLVKFDLFTLFHVNTDDSYYYFQIARNLAAGKFSTFDGGITRTNGYHPLWLFLITPFYWVLDKEAALFGIKAFEIMLIAGGVALIALAARLARLPWILLFALLPMLYQHHALFLGLEAAAGLFMLGLFFLTLMLYARDPARRKWPLSAAAFALPWVRLEYVAISLTATAALCLIEWSWQERPPGTSWKELVRSIPPLKAVVPLLAAGASILVYFAYNGLVFGGIVPVSGATKQAWSELRWVDGQYSLARKFQDILQIPAFDHELLVALGICICSPLVWWFIRRSRTREDWLLLIFLVGVLSLAAGHLAKFAQTVLTVAPRWAGYPWYFAPAYLMMALFPIVGCYVAVHFIRRLVGPKSRRTVNIMSTAIVIFGAVFLLAKASFTEPFDYVNWQGKVSNLNFWSANFMGTLVMNRLLPEDSIVGSWDAGFLGYFSDFPVVNLDGLVNDYDFFHDYAERGYYGGGVYHLDDFAQTLHQEFGITHYAQTWPTEYNFDNTLYEGVRRFNRVRGVKTFKLWAVEPLPAKDAAAWFWARMEPHFDYESEDVAIVVDGRMAQLFARDCELDDIAVVSWETWDGSDSRPTLLQERITMSLCVAAIVLPNDAVHPVWVKMMPVSDYLAEVIGDSQPAIRSEFDVYRIENRLIYVKQQCEPEDVAAWFFLHLDPVDVNDLPAHRKQYGFDNLDSRFDWHGTRSDGKCWATVSLPEYGFTAIRTGQYIPGEGRLWEVELRLGE